MGLVPEIPGLCGNQIIVTVEGSDKCLTALISRFEIKVTRVSAYVTVTYRGSGNTTQPDLESGVYEKRQ